MSFPNHWRGRAPTPVILPERELHQAEAERFWRGDRTALRKCGSEKTELLMIIEALT